MSSLSGPRLCANGEHCITFKQTEQVQKLPRSTKDDICGLCRRAGIDVRNDVPGEHRELITTARALLKLGLDDEQEILATLAVAALADKIPEYRQMRDVLSKAEEDSPDWEYFAAAFAALEPQRVVNELVLFRRRPVDIRVRQEPGGMRIEEIILEIHDGKIKAGEIARLYEKALSRYNVRYVAGCTSFTLNYLWDRLKVITWLEQKPGLAEEYTEEKPRAQVPAPQEVAGHCYVALQHHHLAGRQRGDSFKPHNLIPACVGWYLGGRSLLESREVPCEALKKEVRAKVERYITEPCADTLPIKTRQTIWRDMKAAAFYLRRIEQDLPGVNAL